VTDDTAKLGRFIYFSCYVTILNPLFILIIELTTVTYHFYYFIASFLKKIFKSAIVWDVTPDPTPIEVSWEIVNYKNDG
jgi:hypothetical protein